MSKSYMALFIRSKFFILFLLLSSALFSDSSQLSESLQFKERPIVIISDWHIGATMWQVAVLRAIGIPVEAYSLSGHRRYAGDDPAFREDPLFVNLGPWSQEKVREEFTKNCRWSNLSYALCSFPPSYVTALEKLPPHVALFLNIGHRIHICTDHGLIDFTRRIVEMKRDPRYTIAAMSEYDFHYMRYYTGLEPLRLPVICQHIPQKLRDAAYAPSNRVVFFWPSHASTLIGFDDLDNLNRLSASFAKRYGLKPYTFRSIQSLYPNDQATVENLAKHPAVLINPYSAFSISMVELYQLNIPFFVPDDSLLVNKMGDVRLNPLYHSKEMVARLEKEYQVSSSGYPYSPNDESPEAQQYWLQFMFFNQVKHAQHWTDPEDLFRKLYLNDLRQLHDDMQAENTQLFKEQLKTWAALFGKD
jgi:hypothetical protein